jgi:HAE1 family hydrophobic/amphiphilic exporter-1
LSPAQLSVRRPVFIASLVILMLALGMISLSRLPVDLYPDITFPTVVVQTVYGGAGPLEIENEVTRVLEDEVSVISGVQKVSSQSREGVSVVIVEFNLKTNLNFAEQQVRAKVSNSLRMLPEDVSEPIIRQISPSDAPILGFAMSSSLPDAEIYDLAKEVISPQFEQIYQVGQVDILGGRRREVHVNLDLNKMRSADISASAVVAALQSGGRNIPIGKTDSAGKEYTYRTIAQYRTLGDIENTVLRLANIDYPVTVGRLANVTDSMVDEVSRTRLNGQKAIYFNIFRQSGANSVRVADAVKLRAEKINADLKAKGIDAELKLVNDRSRVIRNNVFDVYESIFFGILLTIIVVYFFLGSWKSTLITGFALPNSLLGACIMMLAFGFSINIMSLLAMSLVVGLLVDDAIVVRENIFRKLEQGLSPKMAAVVGTNEVTLAVVATTLTILAVFGPIGNLQGIVGQFFTQFGLTVCFAMIISLFDGLFVAPAMSAYIGGNVSHMESKFFLARWNSKMLKGFDRFQSWLEKRYARLLHHVMRVPWVTLVASVAIFIGSIFLAKNVPFTFLPPADNGEFFVTFELEPGSSLDATEKVANEVQERVRQLPQVEDILMTIGSGSSDSNKGDLFLRLVPSKKRKENTSATKLVVRKALEDIEAKYRIKVTDQSGGGGQRQFNMNLVGQNLEDLIAFSEIVRERISKHPALSQVDSSYRSGKPEFQVVPNAATSQMAGVTLMNMGTELRILVEGQTPATYREKGYDYDVRVRLQDDQRDVRDNFNRLAVPNLNGRMISLNKVAQVKEATGPTTILRENRTRYIQLTADMVPGGPGLGGAIKDLTKMFATDLKPPPGVTYSFVGEAERFAELMRNILVSLGLGFLFIYLVLASLYESFIKPITIMIVIPLAASGGFAALWLMGSSFDLFSMIGCVMLMGLATKNSILLVDYASAEINKGKAVVDAVIEAGETRLRPILMTSFALIAGMIPVAIGLNEASKGRTSLGIVVIGGTISSTILTLVVVPAVYAYIDRFENQLIRFFHWIFGEDKTVV